jgi:periplasmic divalent cation tolerance protein
MSVYIAYTTFPNREAADSMAEILLRAKVCACVNVIEGMESTFFWPAGSGKVDKNNEIVMLIKTTESKLANLEKLYVDNHGYETPCFMAWKIDYVSKGYLDWMEGELK